MIRTGQIRPALLGLALGAFAASAVAAPVTYNIDSAHTYPSFEADHSGGMSLWRGKFNTTTGTITLDKEAQSGSVDITIDTASIDFGMDAMNDHAISADMFDVEQFPTAHYTGRLTGWENGAPTAVTGELTMLGVTLPLDLEIRQFMCRAGRGGGDTCGADAYVEFDRSDFGLDFGGAFGMQMGVVLRIQVEANSQ